MDDSQEVVAFDITQGEKVYYGYYAALETIFRQFISELESFFFDEFSISFEFDFKIQREIKFKKFLEKLNHPKPIFWYELSPLGGDCLLILENRFANLFLSKSDFSQLGKVVINNKFQINSGNYEILHTAVDSILQYFSDSWGVIVPAEKRLKKLVSHRLKAKIMNSLESCVVAQLQVKHKNFRSQCNFCFSAYQLDSIFKNYRKKTLLRGEGPFVQSRDVREHFSRLIEEEALYKMTGVLGEINISRNALIKSFKKGSAIPLTNTLQNNAVVRINGVPLLSADLGTTAEHYSVQINGRFKAVEKKVRRRQLPFAKLQFPKS